MPINFKAINYLYAPQTPINYPALQDINLQIVQNKITAIIGHTGSGKTTLIQHLNALLIPSSGEVEIDEYLITSNKKINKKKNKRLKYLRKKVGLVFQFPEYQLFEETIYKDIAFGPKNFKVSDEEIDKIIKKVIYQVGLDETFFEKSPFELSGGQKRRVAIAGILALDPDILVLDEPTAGLDPQGANEIMDLVVNLNKEGKTIIFVSHDMDAVLQYADQAVVLSEGKMVFNGLPFELFINDQLMENIGLEPPFIYQFVKKLRNKGLLIDFSKIKNMDTMIELIIEKAGINHE